MGDEGADSLRDVVRDGRASGSHMLHGGLAAKLAQQVAGVDLRCMAQSGEPGVPHHLRMIRELISMGLMVDK
jgi:hypothetical protein